MNEKKITLTLENDLNQEKLVFEPAATLLGKRWLNCIRESNQKSALRERDRFYNFPNASVSIEELGVKLNSCIENINQSQPGLITEKFDSSDLQNSVNHLHLHFADGHLIKKSVNEENAERWSEFNNLLHQLESSQRSPESSSPLTLPHANIVVTWEDPQKTPLTISDYELFTVNKTFGTIYANYCQVGRHFYELFLAEDDLASEEHVLPLKNLSADSYIWLGRTKTKQEDLQTMAEIKKWFKKNESKFNKMGFIWGEPTLAIGWLPVAQLQHPICTKAPREQKKFLEHLSQFPVVKSFL